MKKISLKLFTIATMVAIPVSTTLAGDAKFIRYEQNKKVIQTPHYHEFDRSENPNRYGWCGQTALKSAMAAYGYEWDLQSIHKRALEIDPYGKKYGYGPKNCGSGLGYDFCPELNLLKDIAHSFGFSTIRGNAYSESELFNGVKRAIDSGRVVVALSRTYTTNPSGSYWGGVGHFYTIHGYYIANGKKYFHVRDPLFQVGGGATDIHEIPVSTWWRQMKRTGGNNRDYVGYFSIKKS